MRFTLLLLALAALPLSACNIDKMEQKEDHKTCVRYGFEPGTTAFAKCMQTESIRRDKEDAAM